MKSVLISIQPKWVEKICHEIGNENGKPIYEKVVEVRKTRPKLETPFKCYIYQTKSKDNSIYKQYKVNDIRSGKVIGEFVCDRIDISVVTLKPNDIEPCYWELINGSCLTKKELLNYGKYNALYGWHISDLVIYENPKELSEFYTFESNIKCEHQKNYYIYPFCELTNKDRLCRDIKDCPRKRKQLTRPPQSWCYVEVE